MLTNESVDPEVNLSEDSPSATIFDKPKNSFSSSEMPNLSKERYKIGDLKTLEEDSSTKNLDYLENKIANVEMLDVKLSCDFPETDTFKEQHSPKNFSKSEKKFLNSITQNPKLDNGQETEISAKQHCSEHFDEPKITLSNSEMRNLNLEDNYRQETDISEEQQSAGCLDNPVSPLPCEAADVNLEHCVRQEIEPPQKHNNPEGPMSSFATQEVELSQDQGNHRSPLSSFEASDPNLRCNSHEMTELSQEQDNPESPSPLLETTGPNLEAADVNLEHSIQQEIEPPQKHNNPEGPISFFATQEVELSQDQDNHRSPLSSSEASDPNPRCNSHEMTELSQEQDNPESPSPLLETTGPNLEQETAQETNRWEEESPRRRDKPKNSLPYFEMPNPDLEQFILETSETLAVASKPISCSEQSVPKVSLKPCTEEFISFDIVEPLTPVDRFKSKFMSQIQNKHKERSESKASEPTLINLDEEIAPGSKHLVLKETLKQKIAEKKYLHLKEKKMFQEEASDNSSDEDETSDTNGEKVGEIPHPNGSVLENASEESENSNDVDPCFLALRKPDQTNELDEAAEGENNSCQGKSNGSDDENNSEDENNSCDDELDDFYPTSTLKDNASAKEIQSLLTDALSDSDAETEHVLSKKKCRPLVDLSDEESMDSDQPDHGSYKAVEKDNEDENSRSSLTDKFVIKSQSVGELQRSESLPIETDDEGNISISDIPSYQPNGGFRFQDSADRFSQDSSKTSQSSDGRNVPNFMIPSFVPLVRTLKKTVFSHKNKTANQDDQNPSHVGFKGLDNLSARDDDSQNSYDDVVPICSGSFDDVGKNGKNTQAIIASKDSQKKIMNAFKGLDNLSVREDGSQNSYDDVVPICSGSFDDISQDGKITQPEAPREQPTTKVWDYFDNEAELSDDDISQDGKITQPEAPHKQPTTKVSDYFDNEAELSGEDQGSDGDSEDELAAEIEDEFEVTEEGLEESEEQQRKAAELFMKRLRDDDVQDIRVIKERFLEGELGDQSGRSRKFVWSKAGSGDIPLNQGDSSSDSENENEMDVSVKWNLNVEKTKWQMQSQNETEETAVLEVESLSSQAKISKTAVIGMSKMKTQQNFRKRTRGSAFCMDEALLKKFKLEELGS